MPKAHDRGGWPTNEPIDRAEHHLMDWERRMDALHTVLGHKGLRTTDEMRRAIESLEPGRYETLSYYENGPPPWKSSWLKREFSRRKRLIRKWPAWKKLMTEKISRYGGSTSLS